MSSQFGRATSVTARVFSVELDDENILSYSMEWNKNSQTIVEKVFLIETIKQPALFQNGTTVL